MSITSSNGLKPITLYIGRVMLRGMWLLNHRTARKFEIPMLKKIGVSEIFLPKKFPPDFRSADIDYSEDQYLTIPPEELNQLNNANWYSGPNQAVWDIANKYFDVLFFIFAHPGILDSISRNFKGAVIWRTYGLDETLSYTKVLQLKTAGIYSLEKLGNRFWFGHAYEHLHEIEEKKLSSRKIYLPLGLDSCDQKDEWEGQDRRIFFVCPEIEFNSYYKKIYETFCADFKAFPYAIGGSQPLMVNDPHVLGFIPNEQYHRNMRQFRVMFYHSSEPNHIHYPPFEAVRAGMPLVFMGGGMLDRLGGIDLPGRCLSISEAQEKIQRILNDDWNLIEQIRKTQVRLLDPMRQEACEPAWHAGFAQILDELAIARKAQSSVSKPKKRVAVIMGAISRSENFCGAKLLAKALWHGSRQCSQEAEVIFAHLDDPDYYTDEAFTDLPVVITRRIFDWKVLNSADARYTMAYAGYDAWEAGKNTYIMPVDKTQQLLDYDAWVIVSDHISQPVLPVRPYVLVTNACLQRYVSDFCGVAEPSFFHTASLAKFMLVNTAFAKQNIQQYAGVQAEKVHKVPMLIPEFIAPKDHMSSACDSSYFLWITDEAPYKNQTNAFEALKIYYLELDGVLECHIAGISAEDLLDSKWGHLKPIRRILASHLILKKRVKVLGELSNIFYQNALAGSAFLWHADHVGNGTFSVVEAARLGVPTLSADYPAMQEINMQFGLNIIWMKPDNPRQMAEQLKWMETQRCQKSCLPPMKMELAEARVEHFANQYWEIVRECL